MKTISVIMSNAAAQAVEKLPCAIGGFLGAVISAIGGWDTDVGTLLIFMSVDLITGGIILPAVFHKSPKSENGRLESHAFTKGLFRKGMYLMLVLIAYRLDLTTGASYIRNTVIIALILNELISIVENAGLMGLRIPHVITNAIDILAEKSGEEEEER